MSARGVVSTRQLPLLQPMAAPKAATPLPAPAYRQPARAHAPEEERDSPMREAIERRGKGQVQAKPAIVNGYDKLVALSRTAALRPSAQVDSAKRQADEVGARITVPPAIVQRKCVGCAAGESPAIHRVVPSGGAPLPAEARAHFSERFGHDLSGVRIHTGPEADANARALDAEAYTVGTDVVFRAGAYAPSTRAGEHVLAHELAHVVQQSNGAESIARSGGDGCYGGLPITTPSDASEREAERAATQVTHRDGGVEPPRLGRNSTAIARIPYVPDFIEEGAEWVGGKAAGLASGAAELASDVGSAAWDAAQWAGERALDLGENAWACAKATGRSIYNIATLDVDSLTDLLGIDRPSKDDPGLLDTLLAIAQHPCLKLIPGYTLVASAAKTVAPAADFLRGAWKLMENPDRVISELRGSPVLQAMIAGISPMASAWAVRAITHSEPPKHHQEGIWRHLEPKLEYLAENWWDVLKEAAWDLLWPWPGVWENLKSIWDRLGNAVDHIWGLDLSGFVDDLLGMWRDVNSAAGGLYGWFFIASVLVGAIIGAFFGGAGAIPGALAGAAFAAEVGTFLLYSTIAAESASILKAGFDLVFTDQEEAKEEADYEQIANSAIALGITGAMALLSGIAARFARGAVARVRGKFKPRPKPKTPAEKMAEMKAARAEKARAEKIAEGVKKLDDEIAKGTAGKRTPSKQDLDWLAKDPRHKELAYDPAKKQYDVGEAKGALAAEKAGLLKPPVKRGAHEGVDFIDGGGVEWSHKSVPKGLSADDLLQPDALPKWMRDSKHVLIDLTGLSSARGASVIARVMAAAGRLPKGTTVVFVGPGFAPVAVVGGVVGTRVAESVEKGTQ